MLVTVTPQDVRDAAIDLDEIPDMPDAAIQKLINKAAARIEHAFPTADARITSGELSIELVSGIVEDMVLRVLRNPNAKRQESLDDYSYTIDTALSSGELYISDREMALLAPAGARRRRGVGSIRLAVPRHRWPGA